MNDVEHVTEADATVQWSNVQSRLAYTLTSRALTQEGAAAVFPLMALSVSAIGYGFAAFAGVSVAAQEADERARELLARAERRIAGR